MSKAVPFLEYFKGVEDNRIKGMITYPLDEILFVVLCGVLCGFEDIEEIHMWGEKNIEWLRRFLAYSNKLPKPKTIRKVISHLNSEIFKDAFEKWVSSINKEVKGVVAIDGKTIKGSKQNQDGEGALHIVSAFAYEIGIVLGQEKVADKSNEITAIPNLLERLAIEGAVVTIDAMGAQKDIVSRIIDKKADYLLGLKGNQKNLYEDVKLFFEEKSKMVVWDEAEEVDAGHGRVEIRSSIATSDIDWLKERHPDWKNLKSIVKIESGRYHKKTGEETRDVRYYISSLPAQALNLLKYSRAHWSIENSLHWSLDVIFREDSCRTRADYLGENMAIIRKTAFNLLKRDDIKLPLKRRRVKALIDPDYRSKLIFH